MTDQTVFGPPRCGRCGDDPDSCPHAHAEAPRAAGPVQVHPFRPVTTDSPICLDCNRAPDNHVHTGRRGAECGCLECLADLAHKARDFTTKAAALTVKVTHRPPGGSPSRRERAVAWLRGQFAKGAANTVGVLR